MSSIATTRERVLAIVNRVPSPSNNEPHLCPCYEQIMGATYGLLMAQALGFESRSLSPQYHQDVRLQLPALIERGSVNPLGTEAGWQTWGNGFYFNAAIQRIVWVGDRVLTVFARLKTNCCPVVLRPRCDVLGIRGLLSDAALRLAHEHFAWAGEVRRFVDVLNQDFDPARDVSDQNYFVAIRWDVNQRKHAIGGFHRSSAGAAKTGKWKDLGADKQIEYALKAFELVVRAYSEVHDAYFNRKLLIAIRPAA
jgi:hypothetical protein